MSEPLSLITCLSCFFTVRYKSNADETWYQYDGNGLQSYGADFEHLHKLRYLDILEIYKITYLDILEIYKITYLFLPCFRWILTKFDMNDIRAGARTLEWMLNICINCSD